MRKERTVSQPPPRFYGYRTRHSIRLQAQKPDYDDGNSTENCLNCEETLGKTQDKF